MQVFSSALIKLLAGGCLFLLLHACSHSNADKDLDAPPEAASGTSTINSAVGHQYMVVTANPHATKAAQTIIEQGGSAIDAAITAQLVLGLVEPQSSGIGGGAFLLHWDEETQQLQFFDGRETAPANVNENHFLHNNKPLNFFDAVIGGHSVGVPGLPALMSQVHQQQGKLPWQKLFEPAITLALNGFELSPRLHTLLLHAPGVSSNPTLKNYFFTSNNTPKPIGTVLKNPAYAETLEIIAQQGSQAFYKGRIANNIVETINKDNRRSGVLTLDDMKHYESKEREPLCKPYRQWKICGGAPPTSGGSTVLSILGILENFDISEMGINSAEFIHLFAEASDLAFADRNTYIADPDFIDVPLDKLLDKSYLQQRARLINPDNQTHQFKHGEVESYSWLSATSVELPSTTHLSIIDSEGNAVSMTSSIENAFGARLMTNGFLLNNQLTDFSFTPEKNQKKIANRIEAGKRPRSSMSPMMVFDQHNRLIALTGSPGGSRIINYTALSILSLLDWQLSPTETVNRGHIVSRNNAKLELEENTPLAKDIKLHKELKTKGHDVVLKDQTSGLHLIVQDFDKGKRLIFGAADPRREGLALGR